MAQPTPSIRLVPAPANPHRILNVDLETLSIEDLKAMDDAIQAQLLLVEGAELMSADEVIIIVSEPCYWAQLTGTDN
jgi:hypothetical protein